MRYFFVFLFTLLVFAGKANDIRVSDPIIDPSTIFNDSVEIKIAVTWQNSWRCEEGSRPHNWDAAWIFVKHRTSDKQYWEHASIEYAIPGSSSECKRSTDRKGIMMYRKQAGYGEFSDTIVLKWARLLDVTNNPSEPNRKATVASEICVFAIEMVYVPEGAFYLGDGTDGTKTSGVVSGSYAGYQKYGTAGATTEPYRVTTEGQTTISEWGVSSNILFRNIRYYQTLSTYYFHIILPLTFPKGFGGIYCMKSEISQGQYCAFLNKLEALQIHASGDTEGVISTNSLEFGTTDSHYDYIKKYGNTISRNPMGIFEVDDPCRACNFMTSRKTLAYLSWAGLRPMTFMEYEKVCRGPAAPRPGEYPWGRTAPTNIVATSFSGEYENEEYKSSTGKKPNIHLQKITRAAEGATIGSPGRVGAFADSTTDRRDAGASYYGILDLAGNVSELVVHWFFGNAPGFSSVNHHFTGVHGDGFPGRNIAGTEQWPAGWINPTAANKYNRNSGYTHRGGSFMTVTPTGGTIANNLEHASGKVSSVLEYGGNGAGTINSNYFSLSGLWDMSYDGASGLPGNYMYLQGQGGRGVRSVSSLK